MVIAVPYSNTLADEDSLPDSYTIETTEIEVMIAIAATQYQGGPFVDIDFGSRINVKTAFDNQMGVFRHDQHGKKRVAFVPYGIQRKTAILYDEFGRRRQTQPFPLEGDRGESHLIRIVFAKLTSRELVNFEEMFQEVPVDTPPFDFLFHSQ